LARKAAALAALMAGAGAGSLERTISLDYRTKAWIVPGLALPAMTSSTLHVVDHPLVAHRVTTLRDAATDQLTFARMAREIGTHLAFEAFAGLPTVVTPVDTPVVSAAIGHRVAAEVVLVPVLRAGLGLTPAFQEALPVTRVCHVGLRRNEETLDADVYLDGLPSDMAGMRVAVLDPMLATGGSLVSVVDMLKARGATDITVVCLVAAVPGVERFAAAHPDVHVFTAALDDSLNDAGYIVPGLGDAGDRLFGAPVRP
jgi:uracil phosphoribosyltransferase